jgi:Domain of unknown function (DUF1905)/Bacteriocin-protection, YdeI or OmpD-Associated
MTKNKGTAVTFKATIQRFGQMGEKTGWTYIDIPLDIAESLQPGMRKSFRVKGRLDGWKFEGIALIPIGDGNFIMTLNATVRKAIGKRHGAEVLAELQPDFKEIELNSTLMECLAEEPDALAHFKKLSKSHQQYISKWIDSAKTEETIAKRIGHALDALADKKGYPEMLRAQKLKRAGGKI